jgi:hypothetical protein
MNLVDRPTASRTDPLERQTSQLLRAGQQEVAHKDVRARLDSPGDFKGKNEIGQQLGTP